MKRAAREQRTIAVWRCHYRHLFLMALLLSATASGAEKEMLGSEEWPTTVEAAVANIIASMSEEDKETVRATDKDDLILFHHGWGTGIRNYYGLWRGNEELLRSACGRGCHPDEASMVIIRKVWEALQQPANKQ